ncbi:hypothetical protein TNCV_154331 [Trichonephila clavipes]|uniref:Uncharacterized protein n=1 Tax=Trichonephila clavipes TaxID=2585209 RepID=A0A8X7BKS1_TRICX|nr:hypothetical protein TNCV_154331 [Trichonephila clavipes]
MTTAELTTLSPNYHTIRTGGYLSYRQIERASLPTRQVFSGTGLELMTRQPRSGTLPLGYYGRPGADKLF